MVAPREKREDIVVWVRVTLPPGMDPRAGAEEVRRSVNFGRPEVTLMHVLEARPDAQES